MIDKYEISYQILYKEINTTMKVRKSVRKILGLKHRYS
jgi:hypothetical protein